jgi:apolipoprotein N-acyltransferase
LFAVPAWDFDQDRWWHARLAIMRGVENGFAVARSAKDGLLTLSDAYGRVIARKDSTPSGMVMLMGDLPRGPGETLYARIGDAFAWLCLGLAAILVSVAFLVPRRS